MPGAPVQELSTELKVLHKALLEAGRTQYELQHGPIAGATQLLHLLVHDAAFAWLRPLSELMADLDEILDATGPSTGESLASDESQGAVRAELEHLLSPAGGELWSALTTFLQQEPNVAIAYARIRQILLLLPMPPPVDEAAALHAKHRWAELRRHRQPPR
jgi:hypothetical protein